MKKSVIVFSLGFSVMCLTAFGFVDWRSPKDEDVIVKNNLAEKETKNDVDTDFMYSIGPRFAPIKKTEIDHATDISTFFDTDELNQMKVLNSVHLIIIENDIQTNQREIGFSDKLTRAQLQLLQSADYSTGFGIRAEFEMINKETGELESKWLNPHLTIVPETQAEYIDGIPALTKYFQENTVGYGKDIALKELRPAMLYFTVTKAGKLKKLNLGRGSNFSKIDTKVIELLKTTTGKWKPARDSKGNKIEQELVVAFGIGGC